jgi:alkanesulfonate monooxygenase SsuD/methylene tetrahydromethanopterin reductase-like flavin-dependent oxidoreductase (luciferase family)
LRAAACARQPAAPHPLATTAEGAKFDAIFMGDSLPIDETSSPGILNRFDPLCPRRPHCRPHQRRPGRLEHCHHPRPHQQHGNCSAEEHFDHELRYRCAEEFVQITQCLWNSWDADAFLYDKVGGRFFDRHKLRRLDHRVEFSRLRAP